MTSHSTPAPFYNNQATISTDVVGATAHLYLYTNTMDCFFRFRNIWYEKFTGENCIWYLLMIVLLMIWGMQLTWHKSPPPNHVAFHSMSRTMVAASSSSLSPSSWDNNTRRRRPVVRMLNPTTEAVAWDDCGVCVYVREPFSLSTSLSLSITSRYRI